MAQARAIKPVGQDHLATFSPTDPACPGLGLIERRMREVTQERQGVQLRALDAQRRYLESKYSDERD